MADKAFMIRIRFAIAVSILVHAALVAALLAAAYLNWNERALGPGDAVSVWIEAGPGSQPGAGTRAQERQPAPARDSMAAQGEAAQSAAKETAPQTGNGEGAGGGDAAGASGVAGGAGAGGDRTLAAIWRKIDQSKYYPSAARQRGLSGAPRVSFTVSQDGSVAWAKIVSSSGQAMLDSAALATVERAAPLPYYPGPITVAVNYTLEE